MRQGRFQEAIEILREIAKTNGVKITKDLEESFKSIEKLHSEIDDMKKNSKKDESFFTIFRYPRVLVRFLIIVLLQLGHLLNIFVYFLQFSWERFLVCYSSKSWTNSLLHFCRLYHTFLS